MSNSPLMKLSKTGIKGFSDRNLRLCRQFYLEYPMIWQLITAKFKTLDNLIWQSVTAKYKFIKLVEKVHYATGGLSQELFVSKYKLQLPCENELKELIQNEVIQFNSHKQK